MTTRKGVWVPLIRVKEVVADGAAFIRRLREDNVRLYYALIRWVRALLRLLLLSLTQVVASPSRVAPW